MASRSAFGTGSPAKKRAGDPARFFCTDTRGRCRFGGHTLVDALPFCHLRLSAIKPTRYGFQGDPKTLGDHIGKRRFTLRLRQRDVAVTLGVNRDTVRNWEADRSVPATRFRPTLIRFLGYDPRPKPNGFAKLLAYSREAMGLSQEGLARHLGTDESTVNDWEMGAHSPNRISRLKLRSVVPGSASWKD